MKRESTNQWMDGWTDGRTDGETKRGVELRSTRLEINRTKILMAAAFLAAQNYNRMKRYSEEFLSAPKHLFDWLCPSVDRSVSQLVGQLVRICSTIHMAYLIGLLGLVFSFHAFKMKVLVQVVKKKDSAFWHKARKFAYKYSKACRLKI